MFLLLRSVRSIKITEPHTTYASISLPRFTTIDSRFKDIKRFQVCRRNGQSIILCHNASLQRAKSLSSAIGFTLRCCNGFSGRGLSGKGVHREFTIIPHTQSNQSTKPKGKNNNKHSLSDRRIDSKVENSSSSGDDASFSSVQPLIVCNFILRVSLNLDTISRKCGL